MSYTQQKLKFFAAKQALQYVNPDEILGIGSGSTVNEFIKLLPTLPFKVKGAVCASVASEELVKQLGIPVLDANQVEELGVYVDGADEVTPQGYMTKGGGAALTREKILASLAKKFVLIVDETKHVKYLGQTFPLPVEVIPSARNQVVRFLTSLGGQPKVREGVVTDNGCQLIDVHNFVIENAQSMERKLARVPGIVESGIFSYHPASVVITAYRDGRITSYEPTALAADWILHPAV